MGSPSSRRRPRTRPRCASHTGRYSPGYLDCLEETLGQLAFAEEESWPAAQRQVAERILARGLFLYAQTLFELP